MLLQRVNFAGLRGVLQSQIDLVTTLIGCRRAAMEEYQDRMRELDEIQNKSYGISKLIDDIASVGIDPDLDPEVANKQEACLRDVVAQLRKIKDDYFAAFSEMADGLRALRDDLRDFKVVLFGCTKAGKSTVFEMLTQGSGERIGDGRQSMTRETEQRPWHFVKVFDTPGVDSSNDLSGSEEANARKVLAHSDLSVFVFRSKKIEGTPELQELWKQVSEGRKVLVLLNVAIDLSKYELFKRLRKYEEVSLVRQQENIDSICGKFADRLRDRIMVLHALAGFYGMSANTEMAKRFFSQHSGVSCEELLEMSRCIDMRRRIVEAICEDGIELRRSAIRDYYVARMNSFLEGQLRTLSECKLESERMRISLSGCRRGMETECNILLAGVCKQIETEALAKSGIVQFAARAIEEGWNEQRIKEDWKNRLTSTLNAVIQDILQEFCVRLKKRVEELVKQLAFVQNVSLEGLSFQEGGFDWAKANSIIGGVAGLVGLAAAAAVSFEWGAANFWNPTGWVAFGVGVICGIAAFFFDTKEKKKTRLREQLRASVRSVVKESEQKWADNIKTTLAKFVDPVSSAIASQEILKSKISEIEEMVRGMKSQVAA